MAMNAARYFASSYWAPRYFATGGAAALLVAAPTFTDWLRWASREVVRVAVFRPNLRLAGWTAVGGGAPNSYQISLARLVHPDLIIGGFYRRCVGLTENGTPLTAQVSLAAVDATPGSWYWDAANSLLYARSSTGADPGTFTVYHAQVEFRMATTGLVLDLTDADPATGVYHHPWLTADVPTVSFAMEDFFFGQKITATSQITVLNEGYVWYRLLATDGEYWWKNTPVRFYVGGQYNGRALPWSQYAADLTMDVEDVACDDVEVRFELKPLARRLNVLVPPTPYFESTYPNLGDGVRGTKKWIGYGRTMLPPDLTDTSGLGVWTIADAAYQTLFAVHAVNAIEKSTGVRTALTLTTDYTVDLTACTLTIVNASYGWHTHRIEVDVTGKPDGVGGYLSTVGAIVKDLLITFAGVTLAEIDTTAFAQADLDAAEELSVWLKDPRTLASVLSTNEPGFPSIEGSVFATVKQTLSGLWTLLVWSPDYDPATVVKLTAEDFALFRPEPKLETVFQSARVYYNRDHSQDDWPAEVFSDAAVGYLAHTGDVLERHTFLRSSSDAQTMAQRSQLLSGAQSLEIEFAERGSLLAQQTAGDKVLITRTPAPSATGAFVDKPFEIIRLDRQPSLAIAGRLSDLRGIGHVIGGWKDEAALAWSALTAEQRASQTGFWADEAGRVDPADPASEGVSVWW